MLNEDLAQFNDIKERVNLMLDNRLSPEEEKTLLAQIEHHPDLCSFLESERSFRGFIKSAVARKKASPDLLTAIKDCCCGCDDVPAAESTELESLA